MIFTDILFGKCYVSPPKTNNIKRPLLVSQYFDYYLHPSLQWKHTIDSGNIRDAKGGEK